MHFKYERANNCLIPHKKYRLLVLKPNLYAKVEINLAEARLQVYNFILEHQQFTGWPILAICC